MKKIVIIAIVCVLGFGSASFIVEFWGFAKGVKEDSQRFKAFKQVNKIQTGDIIFHTSKSSQSQAIQIATKSKYSHMGIVYKKGDETFVYEAVQPVKMTPFNEWVNRGVNGHYVVKRLVGADSLLTEETINKLQAVGSRFKGKDYDLYFEWSDDRVYCSELVWKMYKEALGVEIGQLEALSDFNLSSPAVQKKLAERYGNEVPSDEKVISPVAMFNSNKLTTVLIKE